MLFYSPGSPVAVAPSVAVSISVVVEGSQVERLSLSGAVKTATSVALQHSSASMFSQHDVMFCSRSSSFL